MLNTWNTLYHPVVNPGVLFTVETVCLMSVFQHLDVFRQKAQRFAGQQEYCPANIRYRYTTNILQHRSGVIRNHQTAV